MEIGGRRRRVDAVAREPRGDQLEYFLAGVVAAGQRAEHDVASVVEQPSTQLQLGAIVVVDDQPAIEVEGVGAHLEVRRGGEQVELAQPRRLTGGPIGSEIRRVAL